MCSLPGPGRASHTWARGGGSGPASGHTCSEQLVPRPCSSPCTQKFTDPQVHLPCGACSPLAEAVSTHAHLSPSLILVDPSPPSPHPGLSGGIYRLGPLSQQCAPMGWFWGDASILPTNPRGSSKGLGLTMQVPPGGCMAWTLGEWGAALPSQLPSLFRKLLLLLLLEQHRGARWRRGALGHMACRDPRSPPAFPEASGGGRTVWVPQGASRCHSLCVLAPGLCQSAVEADAVSWKGRYIQLCKQHCVLGNCCKNSWVKGTSVNGLLAGGSLVRGGSVTQVSGFATSSQGSTLSHVIYTLGKLTWTEAWALWDLLGFGS